MATIVIKDLSTNRILDSKAMSAVRGGTGAPWVFGWISPYVPSIPGNSGFGQIVNLYQISNNYYADQMNNQIQNVTVTNSAANSNINVAVSELGTNIKH
jgi:hypothetical protein